MTLFDTIMVTIFGLLLTYAATHDIVARSVPNMVSFGIAMLGVVQATRGETLAISMLIAITIFLTGTGLWHAGLLGGGDVKLMAGVSLWFPPHVQMALFVRIAMLGGALGLLYLILSRLVPDPAAPRGVSVVGRIVRVELRRIRRRCALPYAVAISSAALLCLVRE